MCVALSASRHKLSLFDYPSKKTIVAGCEYCETSFTCLPGVDYLEHVAVVARVVLDGGQVRVVGPGPVHTEAVLVPPLQ